MKISKSFEKSLILQNCSLIGSMADVSICNIDDGIDFVRFSLQDGKDRGNSFIDLFLLYIHLQYFQLLKKCIMWVKCPQTTVLSTCVCKVFCSFMLP